VATLLSLLVSVGCGGRDDGDGNGEHGLTSKDAADAADRALLDADDLGDGWKQTGTMEPGADADPPDAVETCIGASALRAIDAATLASSERRDFKRNGDGPFDSTRVQVRTVALRSGEAIDPVLALVADADFADCLGGQLEPQVSDGASELHLQAGDVDVDDDYLSLDGVRSARVAIPFHTRAGRFDFDAELDLVVISRDQLASFVLTIALGDPADGEDVARWSGLLADRQRIAQS
jgi:hypothetical protein